MRVVVAAGFATFLSFGAPLVARSAQSRRPGARLLACAQSTGASSAFRRS